MEKQLKYLTSDYIKCFLQENKMKESYKFNNKWLVFLYLKTGKILRNNNDIIIAGSIVGETDELDLRNFRIPKTYTDGVWAWDDDFFYFARKKNIPMPQDFILHMKKRCYGLRNLFNIFLDIRELKYCFRNCYVDFRSSGNNDGIILIVFDKDRPPMSPEEFGL